MSGQNDSTGLEIPTTVRKQLKQSVREGDEIGRECVGKLIAAFVYQWRGDLVDIRPATLRQQLALALH